MSATVTLALYNPDTARKEKRTYWVCARGSPSGYVYDVTEASGTLGRQVSYYLEHYGDMMTCHDTDEALRRAIRAAQRRRLAKRKRYLTR